MPEIPPTRGVLNFGKLPSGSYAALKLDGEGNLKIVGVPVQPGGYISSGAANQDSTLVIAGPVTLFALALQNSHATLPRYVKIYDKATAPTSADTPVARYALAPAGGGISRQQLAEEFLNGLAFRITTGPLDSDTGAASAGDVFVNLDCG